MPGTSQAPSAAPNIKHAKAWLEDAAYKLNVWAGLAPDASMAAAMRDEAATVKDVAQRAPLPVQGGAIVVMMESAIQAHSAALGLVIEAQRWANDADDIIQTVAALSNGAEVQAGDDAAMLETHRRREAVVNMELSLYKSLAHLSAVNQDHDGPVTVFGEQPHNFFWRHVQSGYHGGVIFHAHYADKGSKRLPVGTWSIHT